MGRLFTILWSRLFRGLSTFKRGFVSTFVLDVSARGLSALALVLLVRTLDVGDFAYVVLYLSVGAFAGSFSTSGIRIRYMREEAERVSRGHGEPSSFYMAVVSSAVMIGGATGLALLVATVLSVGDSAADRTTFVGLAALYTLGHASTELAMYHHQAHLAFTRAGVFGVLRSAVTCAAALAAAVGLISSGPVVSLCISLGVAAVGFTVCAPLMLATWGSRHGVEGSLGFGREANWLTVFYMASAGFTYSTMFLVAALLDDTAVASWGAAERYSSIVFGPVPALVAVLRVRTSQHDVVDSVSTQVDMLIRWIKQAALPTVAISGIMAALAPVLIPMLDGGRYPQSVTIFQLLMIASVAVYIAMPASNLLIAQRRYRLLAMLYLGFLLVQSGGCALAGRAWGVIGIAGVAVAFAVISRVTLVCVVLWSKPGIAQPGGAARMPG
jgi:O-antigen/teichoic acid export membrane protein